MSLFNTRFLLHMMEEMHVSKAELARHIGVSRACVTRILNGKRQPSAASLAGLRRAFPQYSLDKYFDAEQDASLKATDAS